MDPRHLNKILLFSAFEPPLTPIKVLATYLDTVYLATVFDLVLQYRYSLSLRLPEFSEAYRYFLRRKQGCAFEIGVVSLRAGGAGVVWVKAAERLMRS